MPVFYTGKEIRRDDHMGQRGNHLNVATVACNKYSSSPRRTSYADEKSQIVSHERTDFFLNPSSSLKSQVKSVSPKKATRPPHSFAFVSAVRMEQALQA